METHVIFTNLAIFAMGLLAGFALADWLHVATQLGMEAENRKLRHEIKLWESGINERA